MRFSLCFFLLGRCLFAHFPFELKTIIENADEDWVFSPFSISSCLSMVADGADGETAEEMQATLQLPSSFHQWIREWKRDPLSPADFELSVAQGIWIHKHHPILPSYLDHLRSIYEASIESVLFLPETAKQINNWIAEKTHQKIRNLLSPTSISPATRAVLVNALYFHGSWLHPFDEKNTRPDLFYPAPAELVQAPFMDQTCSLPYLDNGRFKALILPIASASKQGCSPVCLLVLPHEGEMDPFDEAAVSEILSHSQVRKVHVRVPKFEMEYRLVLNEPLKQLGMEKVFTPFADLSKIDGMRDLYLNEVLHKAFFAFDEMGIEAAAATAAVINCTTSITQPTAPVLFLANRPFYFALADRKTGTILFMGHVRHPIVICN